MKRRFFALALALVACSKHKPPPDAAPPKPIDAIAVDAVAIDARPVKRVTPVKVVAGAHASCAVMSDGSVRCWGANTSGQLGDGTQRDSLQPVTPRVHGAKDLALGDDTACALLDDGSVACWGKLGFGKLGPTLEPAAAPGVNRGVRVFAVGAAACTTGADGAFVCWGDVDLAGHLRRSGKPEHRLPTPVSGLDHVVQLIANAALLENGDLAIWGDDGVPARVGTSGIVEIASSGGVVCGRAEDGSTRCFGPNAPCAPAAPTPPKKKPKGKAKPAKPAPPPPPPRLATVNTALPLAKQLVFERGRICVVTGGGRIQCLDQADRCKLAPPAPAPSRIDRVSGSCARIAGGAISCWRKEGAPREIEGISRASALSAFDDHGCALADDAVWCWDGRVATRRLP